MTEIKRLFNFQLILLFLSLNTDVKCINCPTKNLLWHKTQNRCKLFHSVNKVELDHKPFKSSTQDSHLHPFFNI